MAVQKIVFRFNRVDVLGKNFIKFSDKGFLKNLFEVEQKIRIDQLERASLLISFPKTKFQVQNGHSDARGQFCEVSKALHLVKKLESFSKVRLKIYFGQFLWLS